MQLAVLLAHSAWNGSSEHRAPTGGSNPARIAGVEEVIPPGSPQTNKFRLATISSNFSDKKSYLSIRKCHKWGGENWKNITEKTDECCFKSSRDDSGMKVNSTQCCKIITESNMVLISRLNLSKKDKRKKKTPLSGLIQVSRSPEDRQRHLTSSSKYVLWTTKTSPNFPSLFFN